MTGRPFLIALLGASALISMEAAFSANLADSIGASWTWTDVTADLSHNAGTGVTVGRSDNVSQAGAAACSFALNNQAGDYTPGNPVGSHYPNITLNTPIRERISLDGATWYTRFQGYADSWLPRTDVSGKVKRVNVSALGMLARIAGRKKPLRSALYRAISATAPAQFWPLEEGSSATFAASALAGGPSLRATSTAVPTFGAAGPPGGVAGVDFSSAGPLFAAVPQTTAPWRISVTFKATSAATQQYLAAVRTTDGALFNLFIGTGTQIGVDYTQGDTVGGASVGTPAGLNPFDGQWHVLTFVAKQNGTGIEGVFYLDDQLIYDSSNLLFPNTGTLYPANGIWLNRAVDFGDGTLTAHTFSLAEVALWANTGTAVNLYAAVTGYSGETASDRLTRICGEEGVDLVLSGTSDVAMGPQGVDTLLNLLRSCESADHGLLYDGFGPGIGYQCRSARYNQAAALTLDMATGQVAPPFEPYFDRQQVKNLYAASRDGGGTAIAEQSTGPQGTNTIGAEDASANLNLADDATLANHAAFLLSLGTVDGFRYPNLNLNLLAIPSKAASLLAAGGPGFRVLLQHPANASSDLPPDDIDLIAEGWTETTTADSWAVAANCSPGQPWQIATIDDATFPWQIDSDDTTVHAGGMTSADTSFTGDAATPWTTTAAFPADFPFDLVVGGERMTCTGITGTATNPIFAVTRSVNGVVKAHAAGEAVTVYDPAAIGL